RPLADDARVRLGLRDGGAPPDGDRTLRVVERRQARCGTRPAPLRDARGAARPAAHARRRTRPAAHCARHRRAQGPPAFEVALLAHIRLAYERTPRGRLRRAGGRGETRTRGRPGCGARGTAWPAAEVRGLGGGAATGRLAPDRVAGLSHVRRAA